MCFCATAFLRQSTTMCDCCLLSAVPAYVLGKHPDLTVVFNPVMEFLEYT
jgi:hypothetical protein